MSQPARIALIVGILESLVLMNRCRVDEVHPIALFHQPLDQPVPVLGRLDCDAVQAAW